MEWRKSPLPALRRRAFLAGIGAATLPALPLLRGMAGATEVATIGLSEVAPGVFVHGGQISLATAGNHGDICNQGVVVGNTAVAVVDSSGSRVAGDVLKAAVARITDTPIRYVINTHMHPDHVLGNAAFEADGVAFVGHHKLARALAARAESYLRRAKETLGDGFQGTRIVLPTQSIAETTTIDLGGRTLTLTPRPTAHTDNDLTVLDSATGTLFAGDLLFSEHIPTIDGSILGWLKLIDVLKAEPAQRVVPGHGPASMTWPDALADEQRYFETLATEVRAMIKDNKTMSEAVATVGQSEKDKWQLFADYHARNITAAFAELEWE